MVGIIHRPILTEKITILKDKRQYAFEVDPDANKLEVARAVEKKFNVKVASVRTQNVKGKKKTQLTRGGRFPGRTRGWKKAIVTLQEGNAIELVENV